LDLNLDFESSIKKKSFDLNYYEISDLKE